MTFARWLLLAVALGSAHAAPRAMLIITGAPGEPRYEAIFEKEARQWSEAARAAGVSARILAPDAAGLEAALKAEPRAGDELWLVLIGHGTFDGRDAKFNLRGDDITAAELGKWLKPFERPLVVLGFFAASAPFLEELSGPNRVIATSTRSAGERNYSRLGEFAAEALAAPESDMDGDGTRSILEIILTAAKRTRAFYENDQRIVSEHALIDDNGDGVGTPADAFTGVRADPAEGTDGPLARRTPLTRDPFEESLDPETRKARAAIEANIEELRTRKAAMSEDSYYRLLERLLLEMAALTQRAE